jgi:hypothetical protein
LTLSGKDPRAKPKDQIPESHTEKLELGKPSGTADYGGRAETLKAENGLQEYETTDG